MSRGKQDPQGEIRRRVTDPHYVADFAERVRAGLREAYPAATEEEIDAAMARGGPAVGWATARERRDRTKVTTEYDRGIARTPDELAALRRRLPGGANRGGRADDRDKRLDDYRAAILAMAEAGYRESAITAAQIVERLHRTGGVSMLRKDLSDPTIGGLKGRRPIPRRWYAAKDGTGYEVTAELPDAALEDAQPIDVVLLRAVEREADTIEEDAKGRRIPRPGTDARPPAPEEGRQGL